MQGITFKENPFITALKQSGVEVEEETFNPMNLYLDDTNNLKTCTIKGNSIYYFFKPLHRYITESHLTGVLIYQNKDLDTTIVYKVNNNGIATVLNKYNYKLNVYESLKNDRFEYHVDSKRDFLRFWIDLEHYVDVGIMTPLPLHS